MNEPTLDLNRLADLFVDDTLGELDAGDEAELSALIQRFPGQRSDEIDQAASMLQLALIEGEGPIPVMPVSARRKAEAAMLAAVRTNARSEAFTRPTLVIQGLGSPGARTNDTAGTMVWLGWVAAAACLLIAVAAWTTRPATTGLSPGVSSVVSLTAEQRLEDLMKAAPPDLIRLPWVKPGDDPANAGFIGGECVWSDERNEGYMVFEGLATNDPRVEQYQLWIFDSARDPAHPVDGGVFDISIHDARVVVPVDPRVPITEAILFAVTVERPGGVVVSTRERLPLLAKGG